jgi:RNA polymerase sigma-70 factor (ECF subfamily)
VKPARLPVVDLDEESASWLRRLHAADGQRHAAERELHARLVRIALAEVRRRQARTAVTGPELDDLAHQAAGDAMLAILAKLGDFRGESRFITWAYRFVILEVSSKLGRHYWRNPPVTWMRGGGLICRTGSVWTRNSTWRRRASWPRYGGWSMTS